MLEEISRRDIADLRQFLVANDYTTAGLSERLGSAEPPTADGIARILFATRASNPGNALVRLFMAGVTLEESALRETLPGPLLDMCLHTGILQEEQDRIAAAIVIVPVEDLLFASDAYRVLGSDRASEFVLPAHTRAARFLRHMTLRAAVDRTLDLGCGCGVQALFAARHSRQVVATDINPAALRYTTFNAQLNNIENVECRLGDLFEPVANEQFDLILSNPPFVIGPENEFVYRDNRLDLDEFSHQIVRAAPARLKDGGYLQMLCEWLTINDEQWHSRLDAWFEEIGCDAWVLRSPPRSPADYVHMRLSDLSGGALRQGTDFGEWLDYFETNNVSALNAGMIVLRRRDGDNWFHAHSIVDEPVVDAGDEVQASLAAADFADLCKDDETLLQARLGIPATVKLEQHFDRHEDGWDSNMAILRLKGSLRIRLEIDLPVLAFVNRIDGRRSVEECIQSFCEATAADPTALTPQLLPVVRLLAQNGFLEPVDADA
jgi:methylase of polypeptide subunit release factors